jgi:hypothetical protein
VDVCLIACVFGLTEIVRTISKGDKAQLVRNHFGKPGLFLAAKYGFNDIFDIPIEPEVARALSVPFLQGKTVLHEAVILGYIEFVRFHMGYCRNSTKKKKGTFAVAKCRYLKKLEHTIVLRGRNPTASKTNSIISLLLEEDDLDVHSRNSQGYTALQLIMQNHRAHSNKNKIIALLREDRRYLLSDEISELEA